MLATAPDSAARRQPSNREGEGSGQEKTKKTKDREERETTWGRESGKMSGIATALLQDDENSQTCPSPGFDAYITQPLAWCNSKPNAGP